MWGISASSSPHRRYGPSVLERKNAVSRKKTATRNCDSPSVYETNTMGYWAGMAREILIAFARFSRHCSRVSACDMDRLGDRFYTTGPNLFPQGSQVCLDRVHMYQI